MSASIIPRFGSRCGSLAADGVSAGQRYISFDPEVASLFAGSAGAILRSITVENPQPNDLYLWLFDYPVYMLPNSPAFVIIDPNVTPPVAVSDFGPLPDGCKVRFRTDDTLPAPLVEAVNYFIHALGDTVGSSFTIHASHYDAINNRNPISITDTGTGNHRLLVCDWIEFAPTLIPAGTTVTIEPYSLFTYGILAMLSQIRRADFVAVTELTVTDSDKGTMTAFYGIPGSH